MKVVVDLLRQTFGHAIDGLEIGKRGTANSLGAAEMRQKRAFARSAHARHIVKRSSAYRLGSFRAMCADSKAVRLVAQTLDEVKDRIIAWQGDGALAGTVKLLLAQIAVDAFGNADHGDLAHAHLVHYAAHGADLPCPAVDQQKSGPR